MKHMAEKEYLIRMNNLVRIPRTRYANKTIEAVKKFARKHSHAELKDVQLSHDVNETIWKRGMNTKTNKLVIVLRKKEKKLWVFTPNGNDLKNFEKNKASEKKKEEKKETKAVPKKTEEKKTNEEKPKKEKTDNVKVEEKKKKDETKK
ncbi:MAG: hypothetical protein V1776_00535 [Candidatus Diapherotrites archaeon]